MFSKTRDQLWEGEFEKGAQRESTRERLSDGLIFRI